MNAKLRDFPEMIESERLYLRPCRISDGKMVYDAIVHSRDQLKCWLPFAQEEPVLEKTEENIRHSMAEFILREDIRLLIFRKEDDVFIGSTGLHRMKWDIPSFEIGYWIDTRFAKLGYMTEAVETLTSFAFHFYGAKRVEIRCDTRNIASRKIPENLGFTLEGILRNESMSVDGLNVRDTCVFSKIEA